MPLDDLAERLGESRSLVLVEPGSQDEGAHGDRPVGEGVLERVHHPLVAQTSAPSGYVLHRDDDHDE